MNKTWIKNYIDEQQKALESIPVDTVEKCIKIIEKAYTDGRQIFVFGNGGSASNASHFATDLGKSGSDKMSGIHKGKRFNVMSLNDNVSWMTALGNDYSYEDIYFGQLQNYGKKGDLVIGVSVSGNSPNVVKAFDWAKKNGLKTIALVGAKKGKMFEIADEKIVIDSVHYGRVEDAQMGVLHMFCYAFIEK